MAGHLGVPKLRLDTIGGNCPVQARGFIAGVPFYFRARGKHWSFSVGRDPVGNPDWQHREQYSDEEFAEGWMEEKEAKEFIAKAAKLYMAVKTGRPAARPEGGE